MQSFIKRYAVQYPMLLAGTMQPSPTTKTIADALPQLVNFGAYPTTIFLGRDGTVRSVHAGFAEPGDRRGARAAQAGDPRADRTAADRDVLTRPHRIG